MHHGATYVMSLADVGLADVASVGSKAAHLGSLSRLERLRVPPGFCVTTHAFQQIVAQVPSIDELIERLQPVQLEDVATIRALGAAIRQAIEGAPLPDEFAVEIKAALTRVGGQLAYAVRSSATAEDLPTASFAGQQDTFLNVVGLEAVLEHVRRCWASLFTERAVIYRLRNGFDHRTVHMAVLVQKMVSPQAAGILFTADPITGNRQIASVEASFGLGEALVSGLVNPDVFTLREGVVVAKTIATKQIAVEAAPEGGTQKHAIEPERSQRPALTDAQVAELAQLGRRIEVHFGCPQDIEWCLVDEAFHIVQSRPITTLFPIPNAGDHEHHVYVSVGHQQMMTDPMKPLGLSMWQLTTPRPMAEAGGRLFVDVTKSLASPASRAHLLAAFARSDPLIVDALRTVLARGDFVPHRPNAESAWSLPGSGASAIETDPSIVTALIERSQASLAAVQRDIQTRRGAALLDFILADIEELRQVQFDPRSMQVIMAGMEAAWWLNDHLRAWLGETNAADTLTQSVPSNITSEMGLALLDVADVIRPHPAVVSFLQQTKNENFLSELPTLAGGQESHDAIRAWLDHYGMRGVGEIDITRPRFCERPMLLVPAILTNIKSCEAGAGARCFEHGQERAQRKEVELLARLRTLPDGQRKAEETKRMIDRVRTFAGYREYPKYAMVSRYFVYKQALLEEAERMLRAGLLREKEDIFFLRFQELQEGVREKRVAQPLIRQRRDAFESYRALRPPRVLTSDGEALNGAYQRGDVPAGALIGVPVSAGIIEGRARVIRDMAKADLQAGDILITAFTDPSWTPLFVAIKGLVTEVGGLMTHGAVIAREYGLPAVVGVENATRLIRDGQQIRVNGTGGYVELLPAERSDTQRVES